MSGIEIGWAIVGGLLVASEALALVSGRFEGVRTLLALLTQTTPRRIACLLGWMWLGWHLFVR